MQISSSPASSDDRLLAGLAHASALLAWLGPIGPLAVWLAARRKSSYVRFHALQAMAYQVIGFWVLVFFGLLAPVVVLLAYFPSLLSAAAINDLTALTEVLLSRIVLGIAIGAGAPFALYFLGGLVAGIVCAVRGDALVPWLGPRLRAALERDPRNEERWLASMAHGCAVWLLWGALFPFLLWLFEKDRSPHLRFHSLQALIYQLGFGIFFLLLSGLGQFALYIPAMLVAVTQNMFLLLMLLFLVLALSAALLLSHPLYQAIAIWAMARAAQGRDPRYPLLGRWLARKLGYAPISG